LAHRKPRVNGAVINYYNRPLYR